VPVTGDNNTLISAQPSLHYFTHMKIHTDYQQKLRYLLILLVSRQEVSINSMVVRSTMLASLTTTQCIAQRYSVSASWSTFGIA